jgi:hypothetical protein
MTGPRHLQFLIALSLALPATLARAQSPKAAAAAPLAPAPAPATSSDAPAPADAPAPPKIKIEKGAGGKKIYRIQEVMTIEGKIQKPEAFFFYQKSSINYDWQELKQDFIPKILESVSHAPF